MVPVKKYVVAVSGGVDSMALLDMLAHGKCAGLKLQPEQIEVAHFDHGIRSDSHESEEVVAEAAKKHGLLYVTERVELGKDASEMRAREERYNFLRKCCKKYNADLITAHHQDDLIETMIINLIRGTSWRGLVSLQQLSLLDIGQISVHRPLLNMKKSELVGYAKENNLSWHEDSTNTDTKYVRNYVRHKLIPAMQEKDALVLEKFLKINNELTSVQKEIATELQNIMPPEITTIDRYQLIMWPVEVATEVLYSILIKLDSNWHPSRLQIERCLHFAKTAEAGKVLEVSKRMSLHATVRALQFKIT